MSDQYEVLRMIQEDPELRKLLLQALYGLQTDKINIEKAIKYLDIKLDTAADHK